MTIIEQAQKIRQDMNTVTETLTDEKGLELIALFELWALKSYAVGNRVQHLGKLYRCVQAHTSQSDWPPDITPALWTIVSIEEYPLWVQPTGAQDAYNTGDKITFEGLHYVSLIDNNVWSPISYPQGWEKL